MSFGARLRQNAEHRGDAIAVTVLRDGGAAEHTSWVALNQLVDRLAGILLNRGVAQGDVVAIALPNGLLHIVSVLATWRIGATTLVFDPKVPSHQLQPLLKRAGAKFSILAHSKLELANGVSADVLAAEIDAAGSGIVEDRVSRPGKIIMSGGSTGLPKLMVDDQPWVRVPGRVWGDVAPKLGFRPNQTQLICGAMSHNAPLTWAQFGLFEGHRLVVMESFDPALALAAIDLYQVNFMMVVPTMMVRMLDAQDRVRCSFSSLESLYHTAAPCPVWLKHRWIDLLGPERVFEMYGSGEGAGQTIITGEEWLSRPGSVGRPFETDIRIRDADGNPLGAGLVGELFMRPWCSDGLVRYIGADQELRRDAEGFVSIGDMASMDEDGYVFLAGRRDDAIITGGLKVHPEKVEAALLSHPAVRDAVVVGIADREWGERVHAVVQLIGDAAPDLGSLRAHCAAELSPHELPKSLTVMDALPRDGFGKIRRRAIGALLEDEASSPAVDTSLAVASH